MSHELWVRSQKIKVVSTSIAPFLLSSHPRKYILSQKVARGGSDEIIIRLAWHLSLSLQQRRFYFITAVFTWENTSTLISDDTRGEKNWKKCHTCISWLQWRGGVSRSDSEREKKHKKKRGGIIDHGGMYIKNAVAGGSQFSTFSSNWLRCMHMSDHHSEHFKKKFGEISLQKDVIWCEKYPFNLLQHRATNVISN